MATSYLAVSLNVFTSFNCLFNTVVVCKSIIKNNLLWDQHLQSTSHKQTVAKQQAKIKKKLATKSSKNLTDSSNSNLVHPGDGNVEDDQPDDQHSNNGESEPKGDEEEDSLPEGFFDRPTSKELAVNQTRETKEMELLLSNLKNEIDNVSSASQELNVSETHQQTESDKEVIEEYREDYDSVAKTERSLEKIIETSAKLQSKNKKYTTTTAKKTKLAAMLKRHMEIEDDDRSDEDLDDWRVRKIIKK